MTTTEAKGTPPGDPYKPGVIVQRIIESVGGPGGAGRGVGTPAHVWSERAVLAAWLHAHRRPGIVRRLIAEDFGHPWHRQLFEHLSDLDDQAVTVDLHSVRQHLLDGGVIESEKHLDLVEMWADHGRGSADWHVARVLAAARQRAELNLSEAIRSRPAEAEAHHEQYRKSVADIDRRAAIGEHTRFADHVQRASLRYSLGVPPAIPTGLFDLDAMIGGLRPGGVIVIAARPGVGKSMMVTTIATKLVKRAMPTRVGFISLEMSEAEVQNRIIAGETGISTDKLEKGALELSDSDWAQISHHEEQMADWPLDIAARAHTVQDIRAYAERLASQSPKSVLILDYLQRVQEPPGLSSRERHVSQVSNALKDIAVDLDMAVLAVASMSRESVRRGGKPKMSDLRDSGAIESDADVVLLLYREDENDLTNRTIGGVVDKNRYGPTGDTSFVRVGELGRVESRDRFGREAPQPDEERYR